ncbi:MAG: zinc ribbon domain-containing protein, partial [Clostridiales bacterium]|nr:zinc ribbon domain-containing protein [Clostridiales bacterium]
TKLVGTLGSFGKEDILKYFRGLYLTNVKDAISSYLVKKEISALEINAYLVELSEFLQERIIPTMSDYGIKLANFYVNDISVPEDDEAVKKLKDALSRKAEMDIVGFNYTQERSFDTLEGAAKNQGGGQSGFMGAGIGLGMGVGVGGAFGEAMGGIAGAINTKETKLCPECKNSIDIDKRFCATCGFDTHTKKESKEQVVCAECGNSFSKNMKFCPECGYSYNPCLYCGADMPDGATKCVSCGKAVPKPCPKCGAKIKVNKKFCAECGESLINKCPQCETEIDGTPKFCPECGQKL